MSAADGYVPMAVTSRSGLDESVHFGAVVALEADGSVSFAAGDPAKVIYPRSSNKPMQAVAMCDLGLQLPSRLLALVCASHDGTPHHIDIARRILATVGLDERALRNTPDLPLDRASADAVVCAGGIASALQQNCSGKHSGMVATCVVNGWTIDDYLEIEHPLQRAITSTVDRLIGEPVAHVGVDGCGAPAHAMTLAGLAAAFRSIVIGDDASTAQVRSAIADHPGTVGGEQRDVTRFIRHVPGLIAKDGAEGVFALALADGRAVAVKVADGNARALPAVVVHALEVLGVDTAEVASAVRKSILGHGHVVGEIRSIVEFDRG